MFILTIAIVVLNNGISKKIITQENRVVTAQVLEVPNNCDALGRRGGFCKLKFNGQVFIKKINRIFCESVIGKSEVEMLTNKQGTKLIFLNEYEKTYDILSGTLLGLFGIVIVYKGWKNKNRS